MWQAEAESPCNPDFLAKGDEIQRLNVIEALPKLLSEDANSCITRVLPKILQYLPTASTEIHAAASVVFKQVLEQRLVSHATYTEVFLPSILSMLENREPVISHAWLETVLDVIELLPVDIIKSKILPIAIKEGKSSQVNSKITCCQLIGKMTTRLDHHIVKNEILPVVQKLYKDSNNEVRACICLQIRYFSKSLGSEVSKVLPYIVELTNDKESNVRQAAMQTIGDILPQLAPEPIKDIAIPLIKMSCENAIKLDNNEICIIAQEFGKYARNAENYLTPADKTWFLTFFTQLTHVPSSETRIQVVSSINPRIMDDTLEQDRAVNCRRYCAFNMPAMFKFASTTTEGVKSLINIFRLLSNDSYYMVRRTIACNLYEIMTVLGSKCGLIKNDVIRLLKDENEEILQGVIPRISEILGLFVQIQIIGPNQNLNSSTVDIGRAVIKCESVIASTNNWRLSVLMLSQLEMLPKCFPSDFVYNFYVPIVTTRIMKSRPLPVRLAAGRTLLIFLRYNLNSQQRIEIRKQICNDIAQSSSCYVRLIFIRMMIDAMMIFSSIYFKEHFCSTLLNLMKDPVANVRLKVIALTPTIKSCLRLPADKKLLSTLETNMLELINVEKDRDVSAALLLASHKMEKMTVTVDSQPSPTKLSRYDSEDIKKYQEEKQLETTSSLKPIGTVNTAPKKSVTTKTHVINRSTTIGSVSSRSNLSSNQTARKDTRMTNIQTRSTVNRQNTLSTGHVTDVNKASTSSDNLSTNWSRFSTNSSQLTQPWERATTSTHNTNLTSTNPSYNAPNEYPTQKVQCSCYELADRIFRTQAFPPSLPNETYRTDSSPCFCQFNNSDYLKTTNLFHPKHDYRFPDFSNSASLTNSRDDKHNIWQDLILRRSNLANKYRMSDFSGFQSHYNPCWTFSSMPEIPVTLVDDEFLVDAGIRIPPQLASSPSTSKILNLQDILSRNKKMSNLTDRRRRCDLIVDRRKVGCGIKKSFSLDYGDEDKIPSSILVMANKPYRARSLGDGQTKSGDVISQNRTCYGFDKDGRPLIDRTTRPKLINSPDQSPPVRTLRRFATLDINHNQGLSKIPVRNLHLSGSRTAPVTRTSSPIRVDSEMFKKVDYSDTEGFAQERRLRRLRSSDEEVDKLCQKF